MSNDARMALIAVPHSASRSEDAGQYHVALDGRLDRTQLDARCWAPKHAAASNSCGAPERTIRRASAPNPSLRNCSRDDRVDHMRRLCACSFAQGRRSSRRLVRAMSASTHLQRARQVTARIRRRCDRLASREQHSTYNAIVTTAAVSCSSCHLVFSPCSRMFQGSERHATQGCRLTCGNRRAAPKIGWSHVGIRERQA
jgi:hypothetical protein